MPAKTAEKSPEKPIDNKSPEEAKALATRQR